jgi:hypothetical protein
MSLAHFRRLAGLPISTQTRCVPFFCPGNLDEIIDKAKYTILRKAATVVFSLRMPTALAGQSSWQQKHRMQPSRSTHGLPVSIAITGAGQLLAHRPQPVQVA